MKKAGEKESARAENIILCEGADDEAFIVRYLEFLKKNNQDMQFQVMQFGGKNALSRHVKNFHLIPNVQIVKSIVILRDADNDYGNAEKSITGALKQAGYATPGSLCEIAIPEGDDRPQRTAYGLFPGITSVESGTLEDLCLKILRKPSETLMDIARESINSVQAASNRQVDLRLKACSKNKFHTYLSLTNEYVGCRIGMAAERNAYDFASPVLEPLRKLLFNIAKEYE